MSPFFHKTKLKPINIGQFIPEMGADTIYMYKTPQIFHPFFPPPPIFPEFVHKISTSGIKSKKSTHAARSDCPALFGFCAAKVHYTLPLLYCARSIIG
jgi:hypothetical protein